MLVTDQAMKNGKEDPAFMLIYLPVSKNELNIDYCKYIVDVHFIPTLYNVIKHLQSIIRMPKMHTMYLKFLLLW